MTTLVTQSSAIKPEIIPNIICNHLPHYEGKIIKMDVLKGLTNVTYKIQVEGLSPLVFRKFGGNLDRTSENNIYLQLQKLNVAPQCFYACGKYRIQKFIVGGSHPSNQDLFDPKIVSQITKKIYEFHKVEIPQLKLITKSTLVDLLFKQQQYQKIQLLQNVNSVDKFDHLKSEILMRMGSIQQMKKISPSNRDTIRFCHNDLNNLNILISQEQTILIDFEYSSYNYLAYDIANFLNETTIDYSNVPYYPGFKLIKTLSIREIEQAAKCYPQYYESLVEDIIRCLAACNLYWAIWSVVGGVNPNKGDFSIIAHGILRISLYDQYLKLLEEYIQQKK